jgi:uncharacterized protein (TIGR03000 family)
MPARTTAAVLLAALPGVAVAGPHKPDYQLPPPNWTYHDLPGGPYLTTCYPFAGWPGYRGAYGGFWLLGPGPHRPVVPVYAPLPAVVANPDPQHLPNKPHLGYGVGTYGWVGPFRASPRHLPYSVSVYPTAGSPSFAAPAAANPPAAAPGGAYSLTLRVNVPPAAELFVDGVRTNQTGADRLFESPPVDAGREVRYDLTARWVENGSAVERTRIVTGRAGDAVRVDFATAAPAGPAPAAAARR